MTENNLPKIKTLRKEILIIGIIIITFVVGIIVLNLVKAGKIKKEEKQQVSTFSQTSWYQNQTIQKPVASTPAMALINNPNGVRLNASQPAIAGQPGQQLSQVDSQQAQQEAADKKADNKKG